MKKGYIILFCSLFLVFQPKAQLYINTDVFVQNGGLIYAQDTIQLANSAVVATQGIIQSALGINTNGHFINTGTTGFIISPVANNVAKTFDIGTTLNNKIQLQHTTGSTVTYQMAVRDNVFKNPQTNSIQLTSKVVDRTWQIQPLIAATNCNATLYWDAASELSFSRTSCAISKWINSVSAGWTVVGSYAAATNTGTTPAYYRSIALGNLTTNNIYLGIGNTGSALPVDELTLDARAYNKDVLINWNTVGSYNAKTFELEKSSDAIIFSKLYSSNAILSNNATQKYTYTDVNAFALNNKILYYRVKQIDNDGQYYYSNIKSVISNFNNNIYSIYPNPAKGQFYIKLFAEKESNANIILYDEMGKLINIKTVELKEGVQIIPVSTAAFATGVYQVIISTNSGIIGSQQIIIQ